VLALPLRPQRRAWCAPAPRAPGGGQSADESSAGGIASLACSIARRHFPAARSRAAVACAACALLPSLLCERTPLQTGLQVCAPHARASFCFVRRVAQAAGALPCRGAFACAARACLSAPARRACALPRPPCALRAAAAAHARRVEAPDAAAQRAAAAGDTKLRRRHSCRVRHGAACAAPAPNFRARADGARAVRPRRGRGCAARGGLRSACAAARVV
jgi:hypothetical protein